MTDLPETWQDCGGWGGWGCAGDAMRAEIERLRAAIRQHRTSTQAWSRGTRDDQELWSALGDAA